MDHLEKMASCNIKRGFGMLHSLPADKEEGTLSRTVENLSSQDMARPPDDTLTHLATIEDDPKDDEAP